MSECRFADGQAVLWDVHGGREEATIVRDYGDHIIVLSSGVKWVANREDLRPV